MSVIEVKTPIKAIRAKCLDCCAGAKQEVRYCTCKKLPFVPLPHG